MSELPFSRDTFVEKLLERILDFLDHPRKADILIMFGRIDKATHQVIPPSVQIREYDL